MAFTKILLRIQLQTQYARGKFWQRWSRGHKARGQRHTQKKNTRPKRRTALPMRDTLEAKGRNAQGSRTQCGSDLRKKSSSSQNMVNFPEYLGVIQENKMSSKIFLRALWRSSRGKEIGHDLGPFSTSQKIVVSSSRGLVGFEAKV